MQDHVMSRRRLLAGTAVAGIAAAAGPGRAELVSASDGFAFEVQRSEADWRAMLSEHEYRILRQGGTEEPRTSQWWDHKAEGTYHCKGCDLSIYSSHFKIDWQAGWAFFFHSLPNNVLLGIDANRPEQYGEAEAAEPGVATQLVETHCRRCGSHLGHIVMMNLLVVHCINGTSLTFQPAEA